MISKLAFNTFTFLLWLTSLSAVGQSASGIVDLADRREIFVDNYLLEKLDGVRLSMHAPRNEGSVLAFDKPWEGSFSAYCTIIKDEGVYRAYYRGIPQAGKDGDAKEVTCYAESADGINWKKPELGIFEFGGTKNNNIILANAPPVTHNFCPFLDKNPKASPDQKYKAIGGIEKSGLVAYVSPDGVHWKKLREEPVFRKGVFDSQNVAFWSEWEGKYVCYFRTWSGGGYKGFRSVSRTTSVDFVNWTEPEAMTFGNTPLEHLYTQQTSPYFRAPHIYLAIGARFMPDRQVVTDLQSKKLNVNPQYYKDCSDAILMSSRGGNTYDRTFLESFIRPGIGLTNWVSRSNYPALNVVQTGESEMSVYVNEAYAQPTAHMTRYSMRLDGFSSLSAGISGGEVLTQPFIFKGKELEINYATSAAGEVRIEVQDENGNPVTGFRFEDSLPIIGNEIRRIVSWKDGENLSKLASMRIKLKILIKDADLYSIKFN